MLASAPFFLHLNLAGQEFPLVQTDEAFYRDGVSLKIRNDFAVGINDYRGAVLNTG